MNDSDDKRPTDPASPASTQVDLRTTRLLRRTVVGWLGLLASLGSASVARGRVNASQPTNDQATETAEASTRDANGGTVGLGCIGIFVRDLPASLDFYRTLGLAIPDDAGGGNDYRLRLPNGQVFFWETYKAVRDFDPGWQPSSGNRRIVLEFGFSTAQALDDKYAELTSMGYQGYLAPFTFAHSTVRLALVQDPDGNEIGIRSPEC